MLKIVLLLFAVLFSVSCQQSPRVLWTFKTQAPVYRSPAICENKLIVGSNDHHLYALDLETGKEIWKTNLGERLLMRPLVEGNMIYVGATSGYFFAVDGQKGTVLWKFKTGGLLEFDSCADQEGIYFGSYDSYFYKLNRQGNLVWKYKTGFQMSSSCLFYKDMVITTSWDEYIHAIRSQSGETVWKVFTDEFNYGVPFLLGDHLYYGTHSDLYKLEAATGKILLKKKIDYVHHALPFENHLFTDERGLTKRTLNGDFVKSLNLSAVNQFSPQILNNYIVQSETRRYLYALTSELETVWRFRGKGLFCSPGVLHNGVYFIGDREGHVYALRLPS